MSRCWSCGTEGGDDTIWSGFPTDGNSELVVLCDRCERQLNNSAKVAAKKHREDELRALRILEWARREALAE